MNGILSKPVLMYNNHGPKTIVRIKDGQVIPYQSLLDIKRYCGINTCFSFSDLSFASV